MAEEDENNEAEEGEENGVEESDKGSKKKLIFIAAGALVLLVGLGAGAYFMGFFDGGEADNEEVVLKAPEPAYFYELPEMTVNLSATEKRAKFLKIQVALELSSEELVQQIKPLLPRIIDAFQVYLRELRISDLEGSAGTFRLKQELQRRINLAIHPAKVDAVLFREIIIQ